MFPGRPGDQAAFNLLDIDELDNISFEDSDRFEEDSLCSWSSEPESVCNNWRGWKKPTLSTPSIFGPPKKVVNGKSTCSKQALSV